MSTEASLERLEIDVLARIATHRQQLGNRRTRSVGVAIVACALVAGVGAGFVHAQRAVAAVSSEGVVLADDASLAPSTLLASTQ